MQNLAKELLLTSQKLNALGLNKGTSGNCSVRSSEGFLITPSAMLVEEMSPASMVAMQFDGTFELQKESNAIKPSSEWRFHRDILQSRLDVNAVVHTHSMFATTLA